ncbi:MAG: 3-isopropylmalate dehydratase small subunit [Solirubrobacteraceae bacterium]
MKAIETITGPVSVLSRDDVDTDQIIPKQFLKRVERTGFGEFLFYDWAKEPDWNLPANPILVTGRNFGCGSSREHAPWALEDYGFQAVIASSFADIFRSNCTKIGLLPVQLTSDECAAIAEAGEAQVDLAGQEVRWPGGSARFEIDPDIKHRLLNGLDDIALTLEQEDAIAGYEHDRERSGPVTSAL